MLGKPELELAKKVARQVWEKYDDTYGYRTEKQTSNDAVSTDNPENIWFFWGQFDSKNHHEFVDKIIKASADLPDVRANLLKWATTELSREEQAWDDIEQKLGFRL